MYSLRLWTNPRDTNDVRVYVNGTNRQAVYLKCSRDGTRVVWSSKANDTPTKFRTGDHYGKVRKDGDAAREVAAAYSITLGADGQEGEWNRLLAIVADGIEIQAKDA